MIMSHRNSIYLVAMFLSLTNTANAMDWFNERVPTKKLVTPVISFNVDPSDKQRKSQTFQFKYKGQYSVNLILYGTDANQPPRAGGLPPKEFSLRGAIEVENSDGVFISSPFDTVFGSSQTGAYLISFEIDEDKIDKKSIFQIEFEAINKDLVKYFKLDETQLYVRKELRESIFD